MSKKFLFVLIGFLALLALALILHRELGYTTFYAVDVGKPKDAFFYVAPGYTGGLNDTPVVYPRGNNTIYTVNNLQLFFDTNSLLDSDKKKFNVACALGRPSMRVYGNVTMTTDTAWGPPITGADAQYPIEYYKLKVNKLYDVKIKGEDCK